jgi:hypothetical protein
MYIKWTVHILASVILLLMWEGSAWVLAQWRFNDLTQDQWFVLVVAATVAAQLCKPRSNE